MSMFDIYVKVSILIKYKTKQPLNLAWHISLTLWQGARFSVCLSVYQQSCYVEVRHLHGWKFSGLFLISGFFGTCCAYIKYRQIWHFRILKPGFQDFLNFRTFTHAFMSVSILINYKTKQQSNLVWNISLTSWLCDIGACFSIRSSVVCLSINSSVTSKFDIYVKVSILINYNSQQPSYLPWHISMTSRLGRFIDPVTWPIFCAPLTLTQFTLTLQIFSTIRCTTTKSCIVLLLDVLTRQVPWPGDLDLYFALQWLWHICVDVRYLRNYKAYNHQTLQSASSQCTDSADTLTWWPWPIFWLQWLWHNLRQRSRSHQV